jgi:uncharacterized protein (TIGR00255 family)
MTGFGRATVSLSIGQVTIEIQSINRRFLEITLNLPAQFYELEQQVRQWIKDAISRGYVSVNVSLIPNEISSIEVKPNISLARQLHKAWLEVVDDLKLKEHEPAFSQMLCTHPKIFTVLQNKEDGKEDDQALHQGFMNALSFLKSMRQVEGQALFDEFSRRLVRIEEGIRRVQPLSLGTSDKYRIKLLERLQKVLEKDVTLEKDDRILQEIALYAEKIDVSEELIRVQSHIDQFRFYMQQSNAQGIGKTLEFLLQELHREINTIGSKCADATIAQIIVELKSELEKMREQVQNIE